MHAGLHSAKCDRTQWYFFAYLGYNLFLAYYYNHTWHTNQYARYDYWNAHNRFSLIGCNTGTSIVLTVTVTP